MADTPANLVDWFQSVIKEHDATFIEHLVWFNELVEELLAKKVGIYGVSAQPPSEVDRIVAESNLKFKCWSDVDLTLRNYLKEQGLLDIVITGGPGTENEDLYLKIREYTNGMNQPAILLVKPDQSVIYSWASQPVKENKGGATGRPEPKDVWAQVKDKI